MKPKSFYAQNILYRKKMIHEVSVDLDVKLICLLLPFVEWN